MSMKIPECYSALFRFQHEPTTIGAELWQHRAAAFLKNYGRQLRTWVRGVQIPEPGCGLNIIGNQPTPQRTDLHRHRRVEFPGQPDGRRVCRIATPGRLAWERIF